MDLTKRAFLLEIKWPNLKSYRYKITSLPATAYNCVAWAIHEDFRRWSPEEDAAWPPHLEREEFLETWEAFFAYQGFEPCSGPEVDPGHEKIAIYFMEDEDHPGRQRGMHVARQIYDDWWASKLGGEEDIEHQLAALDGRMYGREHRFMRRPLLSPSGVEGAATDLAPGSS